MSRKRKRTPSRKRKSNKVTKLPARRVQLSPHNPEQKLSELIKGMAWLLLKDPGAIPSLPAAQAALMLASVAWNIAVGDIVLPDEYRKVIEQIDRSGVILGVELRCDDIDKLIAELVEHKRERYPNDFRRIIATEMSREGNVRVHWVEQEKIITANFGSTSSQACTVKAKRSRPIADKLVGRMKKHVRSKVIDLKSVMSGRAHAEELQKTVATMTVSAAFGMHDELVRVIGLMQESRMGVYIHQGGEKDAVVLRELVTDRVCRAIVASGYRGRKGELWYMRVLPPPLPGLTEHVVFTTPYLLVEPREHEWQAYFRRTLPDAPLQDRIAGYAHHMKVGPTRDYWTEFVFDAYLNHRTDVIFLAWLPDVPESRPHSRVNSR